MKITRSAIAKTVSTLLETGARKATLYLDDETVVTATRRHKPDKRANRTEMLVTIGQPNYYGRRFIRACRKSGEPFPVKKLQLKFWPKR